MGRASDSGLWTPKPCLDSSACFRCFTAEEKECLDTGGNRCSSRYSGERARLGGWRRAGTTTSERCKAWLPPGLPGIRWNQWITADSCQFEELLLPDLSDNYKSENALVPKGHTPCALSTCCSVRLGKSAWGIALQCVNAEAGRWCHHLENCTEKKYKIRTQFHCRDLAGPDFLVNSWGSCLFQSKTLWDSTEKGYRVIM